MSPVGIPGRFVDGAQEGENQGWRYVLSLVVIPVGYVGLGLAVILLMSVLHGLLAEVFPGEFSSLPLFGFYDSSEDWQTAPTLTGVMLFAGYLGSIIVAIPLLYIVVRFIHRRSLGSLMAPPGHAFDWSLFRHSLLAAMISLTIVGAAEYVLLGDRAELVFEWSKFRWYLPVAIVLVPLQVCAEELMFRGYLLQAVAVFTSRRWLRIGLPAVIFALMHLGSQDVRATQGTALIIFLVYGIYLTWFAVRTDGLAGTMGLHLAINLFALLIISSNLSKYLSPTVWRFDAVDTWMMPLDIIAVLAIFHGLMRRWHRV